MAVPDSFQPFWSAPSVAISWPGKSILLPNVVFGIGIHPHNKHPKYGAKMHYGEGHYSATVDKYCKRLRPSRLISLS